ncbi:MAG TPA: SRPBCC domain-containing protein [Pirellulales bacterium]|nr:SRPBCC domain-containing protein [Pirellulales bacterium]
MATPLTFGGSETFSAPQERLFTALTDLDELATTIPDLVSSERIDERTLNCVVRPGFSFLRGTLRLAIKIVELQPPQSARMDVTADGIGTHITVESDLKIEPTDGGSRLDWTATVVELKGLVATVSRPLISAAAERTIQNAWAKIHAKLGA